MLNKATCSVHARILPILLKRVLIIEGMVLITSDFLEISKKRLAQLGLSHWTVKWLPDPSSSVHGRAIPETQIIEIYDPTEEAALDTLLHEVIEIKHRHSLRPYRVMVNKLIEGYQELTDTEKDRFIEELPLIFEVFQDSPQDA